MSSMQNTKIDVWVEAYNYHLKPGDLVKYSDNDAIGNSVVYVTGYGVILDIINSRLYARIMSDKIRIVELKYLYLIQEVSEASE